MVSQIQSRAKWSLWPVAIICFFCLAIIGAAAFVVFCNLNGTDLVAHDYYERELRYQSELEGLDRARALEHPATVVYDNSRREIQIRIPQAGAGMDVSGTLNLYRPSAADLDRVVALNLDKSGSQVVDAAGLLPGLWKLHLLWTCNGQEYLLQQSMVAGASAEAEVVSKPRS